MYKLSKSVAIPESQLKPLENIIASSKGVSTEINEEALADILNLAPFQDPRLKKLVYLYLSLVVDTVPESILHVTNLAFIDLSDPNPSTRKNILYFVSDLPLKSDAIVCLVVSTLMQCMQDHSPAIRATAIDAVIKVCVRVNLQHSNKSCDNFKQLLIRVKEMLPNDPDPAVVVQCIDCIARCTQDNDIVQTLLLSLINKISLLDEKSVKSVIEIAIRKGCNFKEDTCIHLLNQLDPLKKDSLDTSLIFETFMLMLNISEKLQSKDIFVHILSQMVDSALKFYFISPSDEKKYLLLNTIFIAIHLYSEFQNKARKKFKTFTILQADSLNVKIMKCKILSLILNEEIAMPVFTTIRHYLNNQNFCLRNAAFKTLYNLYKFLPSKCENVINCLLHSQNHFVTEHVIVQYSNITLHKLSSQKSSNDMPVPSYIMHSLFSSYSLVKSENVKCCLLWLISFCNDAILARKFANHLNFDLLNIFAQQLRNNLIYSYLTTVVKLFANWPSTYYTLLKNVFQQIFKMPDNNLLKYKAIQYYKLLKVDINQLLSFINQSNMPHIKLNTDQFATTKTNLINLQDSSIVPKL